MSPGKLLSRGAPVFFLFASLASAQFRITAIQGDNAFIVPNGSSLSFTDPVGKAETVHVTVTYQGFGTVAIDRVPELIGSPAFTVNFVEKLPLSLTNGGHFAFDIQFLPSTSSPASAQLSIYYVETLIGPAPTFTPSAVAGSINLTLQGTAPSFVLSYVLPSDQNVVIVPPGGSVVFPATRVNTTGQATFNITNRGSGTGKITDISITGAAFKIVGKPLFPVSLPAGQTLQLGIQYVPTTATSDSGQLQITSDPDIVQTVGLEGGGFSTGSVISYQVLQGSGSVPAEPGGTISLPSANIGESSSVVIQVKNTGNAPAIINSISLAGAGFQLTDTPVLPVTLALDSSVTFTITFTPTRPGNFTGRLLVGSDTFTLNAVGLGPDLVFSYASETSKVPIANNTLVFSPVVVSASTQMDFIVTNTGTLPARIANIGIGEPNSPFSLSGLPALPVSIDPGAEIRFPITFTPTTTGFTNGTLRIDATSVNLVGSGAPPPPVPGYTLQGPAGNVAPLSQPTVRLSLSRPYPIAIVGQLTITVAGGLADPAVQFSTGGRTAPFLIPANTTEAMIASQGPQIRLQSGTSSGTITVTPTFATQAGLALTSESSNVLQFTVLAAAPVLISSRISSASVSSFTITVTGYSTTRTLNSMDVKFTPVGGSNVPQTQFTIDLRATSTLWFQNFASQAFGGQFAVSVPFTVRGATLSALEGISSVSVTVSNEVGSSNSVSPAQ